MYREATLAFVLVALLINSGPSLMAQQVPANPKQKEAILRAKASIMVDTLNQRARELGLVVATDDEQEEFFRKRLSAQLQEDFVKLGTTNVETVAVQAGSLDYKSLSATTADLKNRATRIKYNVPILMTPAKGEKPRYQESPDQLSVDAPRTQSVDRFLFRQSHLQGEFGKRRSAPRKSSSRSGLHNCPQRHHQQTRQAHEKAVASSK